jgi:hypothetical protein
MTVTWKVHNAIVPPKSDYEKLKRRINQTTLGYGTALTSTYFITQGAAEGVSATLGVASSLAYIGLLTKTVDNIENSSPFQNSYWYPWVPPFLKLCGITLHLRLILTTVRPL